MAYNQNRQQQQLGNPPAQWRNNQPQQKGREDPPRTQQPRRMRPRDIDRMAQFNERQHERQFGQSNWSNQVEMAENEEEARARPPPQQQRSSGNRRPQRRAPPAARTITKETAPKDEQLYTGNGRDSKPVKNFDCTGFIPLVRQTYDRLCIEDQRLPLETTG